MKVKFLKKHLKFNAGDEANLDITQARYLERVNVAEIIDEGEKEVKVIQAKPKEVKIIKKKTAKKTKS